MGYHLLGGTLFTLLFCMALGQGAMPSPHCKFRPLYSTLPLNLNEILTGDLTGLSTGYNIDFKVKAGADIATVKEKLVLNDKMEHPFARVISHHVEAKGNGWGSHVHFVVEDGSATYLFTGTLKSQSSIPVLDDPVIVEFAATTKCFDAVVFPEQGVAIVDCILTGSSDPGFVGLKNKFIYIDLASRQPVKTVDNEMYVSFANITTRRMTRFRDPRTGYSYMLRTYLAGGVDSKNAGNTYMELFEASDPNDLQVIRVVDRSYLGLTSLSISDFKVYLGDIFLLDYGSGLYRIDITAGQHLTILGFLRAEEFRRFSAYSDDLQDQLLIVLANTHAVHEIDWGQTARPLLVSKYSLMENSHVRDISVDAKYLVVQASSNGTSDLGNLTINYTWIFTKATRTYANAFKVIDHPASDVFVDLNRETHTLLVAGSDGLANYQINDPTLMIVQSDASKLGTAQTVLIEANSTDPHSIAQKFCSSRTTVQLVGKDNMTIWSSGVTVPQEYYANYPGELEVFFHDYVIGPNISYSITQPNPKEQLPQFWINKQNQSTVVIDQPPDIGEINFFHTDVVPHYGNDTVIYYYQDVQNRTHSASCTHLAEDRTLNCMVTREYSHRSKIYTFASGVFADSRGFSQYYYSFTLEGAKNVVTVIDYISHTRLASIELPEGYEGQVQNLAITNGILFATVPAIKTIYAYKLSKCSEFVCPLAFSIDYKSLSPLGVNYFAPLSVVTSRQHPEVLFIKCRGSLLILDVDNHQNLIVLAEMFSAALQDPKYKLAVNLNSMIVVSPLDTIEHYDLRRLYDRSVVQVKSYTLYRYKLLDDYDLEFSDVGDLFYVNAIDSATNLTSILVYRTASYAVAALYDVINLPGKFSHRNLQIEVSGFDVDYVSIIASGQFYLYQLFEQPHVLFIDTFNDFHFRINYSNEATKSNLTDVTVRIANYPQDFRPTEQFNSNKDLLKIQNDTYFSISTRKWFKGHILRYNWTCDDCHNNRIRLFNHVNYLGRLRLNGADYTETWLGGLVLQDHIFRLNINGSVGEVLLVPSQRQNQECLRTVSYGDDSLMVTGCEVFGYGVNLYITSRVSSKAFTWGPYRSEAIYLRGLQLAHNIVAVVDVDLSPERRYRAGGVYLYAVSTSNAEELVQLDYIDSNDFQDAHGWEYDTAYIANAHLVYDFFDDMYRLYLTESTHGLFIIDFKHTLGSREIQIMTTNFLDLNVLLKDNNLHMPKDAIFLAVTLTSTQENPHFEVENVAITTNGFHNFEVTLIYDEARLLSSILHRVYYRYAFYEAQNFVRSAVEYLAVTYTLPEMFDWTGYSRQLVVVYDARDYQGDAPNGYSERYMIGAHVINHTEQSTFGFNTTFDTTHNNSRRGLVVIDKRYGTLTEMSLSRNLTIEVLDPTITDQKIKLTPYNDFNRLSFDIEVINSKPIPPPDDNSDLTLEIIVLIVGCFVTVTCVGYVVILVWRKPLSDKEKSLVEDHEQHRNSTTIEPVMRQGIQTFQESEQADNKSDSVVDAPRASEEGKEEQKQSFV